MLIGSSSFGNSLSRRARYRHGRCSTVKMVRWSGGTIGVASMAETSIDRVRRSISCLRRTSTSRSLARRQSAPMIGPETSATMKDHVIGFGQPMSICIVRRPYNWMGWPVAVWSRTLSGVTPCLSSCSLGGRTETAAPVSIRNAIRLSRS